MRHLDIVLQLKILLRAKGHFPGKLPYEAVPPVAPESSGELSC
jgi:hypothetical protein